MLQSSASHIAGQIAARLPGLPSLLRRVARWHAGVWSVGATAVVIDEFGRVLLAEHVFRERSWALPSGWVHTAEDPAEAVVREVQEETGLAVDAVAVVACERHGHLPRNARRGGLTVAYLCRPDRERSRPFAPSAEITALQWMEPARAIPLLTDFEGEAVTSALERLRYEDAPPLDGYGSSASVELTAR